MQKIKGDHNQVAGRDIINEGDCFKPDPDNPNLTECSNCGKPGLSLGADTCPACGHNHLRDRLIAHEEQQRQAQDQLQKLGVVAVFILLGAFYISPWLKVGYLKAILIVALSGGALWYGFIFIKAYAKTWYEEWKRSTK